MIDPKHLRVLREVARTGSYSETARALGYSQPAISQQMRALERETGTVLVVRLGRRMRLTEAGEVLLRHATGILGGLAAAEDEVAALAGLRAGRVRLVSFPSGTSTLVPAAIAQLTARYDGLRVTFVEAEPPDSIELLRSGECDVALAFSYPDDDDDGDGGGGGGGDGGDGDDGDDGGDADRVGLPAGTAGAGEAEGDDLAGTPLLVDDLIALLPAGHPRSGGSRVALADLAGQRWIAGCPRCRGHLVRACSRAGFTPQVAYATDDYAAVQGLVAAGLGVALVPGLVVPVLRLDDVVALPVVPPARRQITAYTLPGLRAVPAVGALLEALTQVAGRVAGTGSG